MQPIGEDSGQDSWTNVEDFEQLYLELAKSHIENTLEGPYNFLGFAYRGIILRGGREQTMRLSAQACARADIPQSSSNLFLRALVRFYLDHYGSNMTINNLVLETYYRDEESTSPSVVEIALGVDTESTVLEEGGVRTISLSNALVEALGNSPAMVSRAWQLLLDHVASKETANIPRELLRDLANNLKAADEARKSAIWYIVKNEVAFMTDVVRYGLPADPESLWPQDVIQNVDSWLRAFQGLLLFKPFGSYWATAPVHPFFKEPVSQLGLSVPCSAVTTISDDSVDKSHLQGLARNLEALGRNNPYLEKSLSFIVRRSRQDSDSAFRDIVDCAPETWSRLNSLAVIAPKLPDLLTIASKLIGASHEGKHFSFTFLCAPDAALLQVHKNAWQLKLIDKLDQSVFYGKGPKELTDFIAYCVKANVYTLQDPGHALHFDPYRATPQQIVSFTPFDPSRLESALQKFTTDSPSIAIHIRAKDARVFADGRIVLRCSGGSKWHASSDINSPKASLEEEISRLKWCEDLADVAMPRVGKVCSAAREVAKRGYGALFFLCKSSNGEQDVRRTTMGPVWGAGQAREIEDIAPEYLASFAGLDGETFIDLSTGRYATRQFLLLPAERYLHFFGQEDGSLKRTTEFDTYWQLRPDGIEDSQEDIERFGTRHLKALQVTYAFPDSIIAMTVSSDGPIRIWHRGYPVRKF